MKISKDTRAAGTCRLGWGCYGSSCIMHALCSAGTGGNVKCTQAAADAVAVWPVLVLLQVTLVVLGSSNPKLQCT